MLYLRRALKHGLGTCVDMSTTFYPQTECQSERTISMLEDMFWTCVINFCTRLDQHLALAEFTYNKSYHSNIEMTHFEALYGRIYRSSIGWFGTIAVESMGVDMLRDNLEQVWLIQSRLVIAQSLQKSYADRRIQPLEFVVRDMVWLKVLPLKGIMRFRKKGKLSPRWFFWDSR